MWENPYCAAATAVPVRTVFTRTAAVLPTRIQPSSLHLTQVTTFRYPIASSGVSTANSQLTTAYKLTITKRTRQTYITLYNDQQTYNYVTNYHTPTGFDIIVSSSGSLYLKYLCILARYVQRNNEARSRNYPSRRKSRIITHSECVSAALVKQHPKGMCHIVLSAYCIVFYWPVWLYLFFQIVL